MGTHRIRSLRRSLSPFVALAIMLAVVGGTGGGVGPAGAGPAPPKLLGPILSVKENPETTFGRDGGFSVALPNKQNFWVFADSPRYQFLKGKWRLTAFFGGSTAAMATSYTRGKPLKTRLYEVVPGTPLRKTNSLTPFLPRPTTYVPDGSGVLCTRWAAHRPAFSARWPVGAALMPDRTNILIPYAITCILDESDYHAQGWGFALFNYKTQQFTVPPTDVIPAKTSGAGIPSPEIYGSPIVHDGKVTFYSWSCCGEDGAVFSTTVDTTVAALQDPESYVLEPIPEVPQTFGLHVAPKTKEHSKYSMYVLTGDVKDGAYSLYSSASPTGPWSQAGSGVLPLCSGRKRACHSMALHPEHSPTGRMNVSFHVPGYGPGIPTKHPYPHEPIRHVVSASVPCSC